LLSSIAQVSVGCKWIARLYASILLLLILNLASPIARIAPIGWLCEAGRVSYCVSRIHMPVSLAFLSTLRVVAGPIIGIEYLFVNVAAAVASFAVAAASWSYFEAPSFRWARRTRTPVEISSSGANWARQLDHEHRHRPLFTLNNPVTEN
jgi:peptidoglycan/LPS O-acetylase OafA/YrhL